MSAEQPPSAPPGRPTVDAGGEVEPDRDLVPSDREPVPFDRDLVPSDQQPVPSDRRRGRQTALDMVRSLVVILAFVGVVLLLAPQPDAVEQPEVSSTAVEAAVAEGTQLLGATPLVLVPGDRVDELTGVPADAAVQLGAGWRLDYARTEQRDDVGTWRVGVLSPGERRVDLEQAVEPTEEWLTRADAGRPGLPEAVDLGGVTWTVQQRGDGDTVYTWVDPAGGPGALTTAVSASSDSEDLRAVVEAVAAALP